MQSRRGNTLVSVNLNQKNDYEIEIAGGQKLWVNSDFGPNGRETNSVVATVESDNPELELVKGDYILCHHNSFRRKQDSYLYGSLGIKNGGGKDIFSLENFFIYCKMSPDGKAIPLKGFIVCSRIEDKVDTFLEVPDTAKKNYNNMFYVESVGEGCDGIEPGQTIIAYKNSDYEILYSFNMKLRSTIRVRYDDVVAIINNQAV